MALHRRNINKFDAKFGWIEAALRTLIEPRFEHVNDNLDS